MSEKLKPCPFCGEMDRRVLSVRTSEHWIDGRRVSPTYNYVHCLMCGGRTGYHATIEEAVMAWNRRAEVKGDE